MRQVQGKGRALPAAVLAVGIVLGELCAAAEEPPATEFIVSSTDKQCDEFNRSWVVTNKHTYRSIKVRVRWSAVGAKEMQEEFILSPKDGRAIGCASQLEIVSAEILQF
ncbi:hypothetical protein ACFPN2_02645 [Steroidobacter flavus]|uniref:Uncharacterized protein n=1 Tax=Steroidobacter flavus TaxID=1842136 RepID=A0ABV8SKY4_9GAMM